VISMSQMRLAIQAMTVVNVLLAAVLVVVWVRAYWQFRAQHTLGMLAFGALLLVQNGFAIYLYTLSTPFTDWMRLAEPRAMMGMVGITALQSAALLVLARVTWT
jgi:hypothetical protein